MSRQDDTVSLSALARVGFAELTAASRQLDELSRLVGVARDDLLEGAVAADPDRALTDILNFARRHPSVAGGVLADPAARTRIWLLFGASSGLAAFLLRHPAQIVVLTLPPTDLPTAATMRSALVDAVQGSDDPASDGAVVALRVAYRRMLCEIALADLSSDHPSAFIDEVCAALADVAGAALDASLHVARARAMTTFSADEVRATRLAIIGMGKTGARELNYVSDVDVIFVAGTADPEVLPEARAVDIATRVARDVVSALSGIETEPPLWEVDTALRPEGKHGALVRTLASHVAYYERWAKSWEFQALLKARAMAGDASLGAAYIDAVQPKIWSSAARTDFVDSVQRMRERVTEHIDPRDADYQLKLGEGGLRDIEFTVQLLQLVHGLADESLRVRGTLEALVALRDGGYIGRSEAAAFADDYRMLRLLEHRLQLRHLQRTHLMPRTAEGLRVLARASGVAETGDGVWAKWDQIRRQVREIHTKLFYRPLLTAVAALPEGERSLSTAQAHDRLAAIGFYDPASALRHIGALTSGLSRKAVVQRSLMPIMVRWFADGSDPDYGLLAFRRISERLGNTPWFLRMLRDSAGAAQRLTRLLSSSRYIGELMEWIPESVAWLDSEEQLRPRTGDALRDEAAAIQSRHEALDDAAHAVRAMRRRELLRVAMGSVLEVLTIDEVARALTQITEVAIDAALRAVRRAVVAPTDEAFEFAIIAMGRFGGAELGFGSDADVLFVYDANGLDPQRAHGLAQQIVSGLREHIEDHRLPLELDADLRPEGRNGPIVRSFDAYTEYYRRWSLSWEAQALLRARGIAGSSGLVERFTELADGIRYPQQVLGKELGEIKRIKARVEGERLPQGVDPRRHLKLGPGTLSDVEWMAQLLQLQHAHAVPGLRTTSTGGALEAAVQAGLFPANSADRLKEAWLLASRLRSAITLLTGQTSDVLPADRQRLTALARLLGYPDRSADALEEQYLRTTRRARKTFEKHFYG